MAERGRKRLTIIDDLINLSPLQRSKMTKEELKPLVKRLTAIANTRRSRLIEQGINRSFIPLSRFRVGKNASRNQLNLRLTKLLQFLDNKTSTVKGALEVQQKTMHYTKGMTKQQEKNFWEAYRQFMDQEGMKEIYPSDKHYNPVLTWLSERMQTNKYSYSKAWMLNALRKEELKHKKPNDKFGSFTVRN